MYCKKCGQLLRDKDLYCPNCGESVLRTQINEHSKSISVGIRAGSFLKKVPAALLMWFTLIVVIATLLNLIGIPDYNGIWDDLIYLLGVVIVPIAMPIILLRKTHIKTRFYQKWWFWAICAIISLCVIVATTEPPAKTEHAEESIQNITSLPETTAPTEPPTTTVTEPKIEPTIAAETVEVTVPTIPPTEPLTESPTEPHTEPVMQKTPEDLFVSEFCSVSGLKPKTAKHIYSVLHDEMLFEDIQFVGKNGIGQINWDFKADGYNILMTADDDGIYRAICGDFVLFENSKVVLTKEDMLARDISTNASLYYVIAMEIVEANLNYPQTARFGSMQECAMQRNGDIVAVQGYVNAKNAFGVSMRTDFIVEFRLLDAATYSYEVIYIEIGGQTAGKFVDLN